MVREPWEMGCSSAPPTGEAWTLTHLHTLNQVSCHCAFPSSLQCVCPVGHMLGGGLGGGG